MLTSGLKVHNLNISNVLHTSYIVFRTSYFVSVLSSLTYWKKNVRRVSNKFDHNFEISHHFLVGLKKCGRVTTTIKNKSSTIVEASY